MVEAFLANAPDEMPAPRILTILRHYYGLVDAATNDSGMAKLADGRDAALKNYAAPQGKGGGMGTGGGGGGGGVPSRAGGAAAADYYGHGGVGGARIGTHGAAVGAGSGSASPVKRAVHSSHQVLPRPVSGGGGGGGGGGGFEVKWHRGREGVV